CSAKSDATPSGNPQPLARSRTTPRELFVLPSDCFERLPPLGLHLAERFAAHESLVLREQLHTVDGYVSRLELETHDLLFEAWLRDEQDVRPRKKPDRREQGCFAGFFSIDRHERIGDIRLYLERRHFPLQLEDARARKLPCITTILFGDAA